jgi:hypothetical protein
VVTLCAFGGDALTAAIFLVPIRRGVTQSSPALRD